MASEAIGHVYVFRVGEHVKIGRSTKPWRRLEAMRHEYKCLDVSMTYCTDLLETCVLVEARSHHILGDRRLDGEWFSVTPEEAERAVKQAVRDVRDGWLFPSICVRGGMPSHREALAAGGHAVRRRWRP